MNQSPHVPEGHLKPDIRGETDISAATLRLRKRRSHVRIVSGAPFPIIRNRCASYGCQPARLRALLEAARPFAVAAVLPERHRRIPLHRRIN